MSGRQFQRLITSLLPPETFCPSVSYFNTCHTSAFEFSCRSPGNIGGEIRRCRTARTFFFFFINIETWEDRQAMTSKGTENWVEHERDRGGGFSATYHLVPPPLQDSAQAALHRWFTLWDAITSVTFPFNWVTNGSHFWGKGHILAQVKVFSVLYFSGGSEEGRL